MPLYAPRRRFLQHSAFLFVLSNQKMEFGKENVSDQYDATNLLRDLTNETRGAQIATADAVDPESHPGWESIEYIEINNPGTLDCTIIINEIGIKNDAYIYSEGGQRTLGYQYRPNEEDLGDKFHQLHQQDRLADVLNEFYELYVPDIDDEPASELLPTDGGSDDMSEQTSDDMSEQTSDDMSEQTSDDMSEQTSDDMSEQTSDDMSEQTSDDMSEQTSDDMSEQTSDDMSEQTSDDMSEQTTDEIANGEDGSGYLTPAERDIVMITSAIVSVTGVTLFGLYRIVTGRENRDQGDL